MMFISFKTSLFYDVKTIRINTSYIFFVIRMKPKKKKGLLFDDQSPRSNFTCIFKHSQTKNLKEADATKKKTDPEHLPFLDTFFGQWEERHTGYATESEFSVGCMWCDWQTEPRCESPGKISRIWGETLNSMFSLCFQINEWVPCLIFLLLSLFLLI